MASSFISMLLFFKKFIAYLEPFIVLAIRSDDKTTIISIHHETRVRHSPWDGSKRNVQKGISYNLVIVISGATVLTVFISKAYLREITHLVNIVNVWPSETSIREPNLIGPVPHSPQSPPKNCTCWPLIGGLKHAYMFQGLQRPMVTFRGHGQRASATQPCVRSKAICSHTHLQCNDYTNLIIQWHHQSFAWLREVCTEEHSFFHFPFLFIFQIYTSSCLILWQIGWWNRDRRLTPSDRFCRLGLLRNKGSLQVRSIDGRLHWQPRGFKFVWLHASLKKKSPPFS